MARRGPVWRSILGLGLAFAALVPSQGQSIVPEVVAPSTAVLESAAASHLSPDERSDFRVRHGIYDDLDLDTSVRRARVALARDELDAPELTDPPIGGPDAAALPLALRIEALLRRGDRAGVLAATDRVADEPFELALAAPRARVLAELARREEALELASAVEVDAALATSASVEDVLAAVDLGALRIRLDPTRAGEYRRLLEALGRARERLDRLDPRIRLREAQLLAERHAKPAAVEALAEALALDPRSAEGWRLAGELALDQLDFDGAARAAAAIRRFAPRHSAADLLDVRRHLLEDDPDAALAALAPVLARGGDAEAFAWQAACEGSRYDFDAMAASFARFDTLAPGSALALVVAGRQLSFDRQYPEARATLEAAAAREPGWALPRAELGLLAMQDGREANAVADLGRAAELDPHDERVAFTRRLAEQLAGWNRLETRHFVLRHPDGDAALVASLLADPLDRMHAEICGILGHEPPQKTLIDVMPDHRSFGVRITGLPRIHTIAASTGPTIAIEIPKEGASRKHLGLFDPLLVLRHEYVHTVTLSMTRNRIPHWLTEAIAVALEGVPPTFETCQMLASAWRRDRLFDLDEINWAFVRPKAPTDRAQAYAQGRWMVGFMEERFGWDAIRALLAAYADGAKEDEAMRRAFGIGRDEFARAFRAWAAGEVRAWGLDPQPPLRELALELVEGDESAERRLREAREARLRKVVDAWTAAVGAPGGTRFALPARLWGDRPMPPVELDDATVRAFLARHPDHPDLLEILLRRARTSGSEDTAETRELLERYARARPIDPLPHRIWARLATASDALDAGRDDGSARHLRELDLRSDKDNVYALGIARNRRAAGDAAAAAEAAERAVRMNPFDASVRELAAAIAVEAGRLDRAEIHVAALVAIEPDRELHRKRLEAVRARRAGGG